MKTINHEYYVSLEVANLLKEAGFDWECCYCYDAETKDFLDDNEGEFNFNEGDDNNFYSAPTLEVAQRWLREKNLLLYIPPCHIDGKWLWRYWITNCINKEDTTQIYSVEKYDTYEQALEAGIKKALELILEKGE